MSSDRGFVRSCLFSWGLLATAAVQAQPICDVLLQPAFNYSTDGLTLIIADSSRTYGLATTASWSFGDGSVAASSPSHQFQQAGVYTVCLTLTAVEGAFCSSTYCRQVHIPLNTCLDGPEASFDSGGLSTNTNAFQSTALGTTEGSWFWEFGDGTTSDSPGPVHTWALPGPHFVTLTRQLGACTSTYGHWVEVDGNATTCGPAFFVDFYTEHQGEGISFIPNIVTDGILPALGIWSYGDGTIDTTFTAFHTYAQPGSYQTCFLVGGLVPPAMDTCFALVCHTMESYPAAGLAEGLPTELSIHPNPANEVLFLNWHGTPGPGQIRLLDMVGRVVYEQYGYIGAQQNLPINAIAPGQYLVQLTSEGTHAITRVQVQR